MQRKPKIISIYAAKSIDTFVQQVYDIRHNLSLLEKRHHDDLHKGKGNPRDVNAYSGTLWKAVHPKF
jgi:hypothetical protein